MKILVIRGKNLASLEGEFDIDFTTEALKSAGIFTITGNTGSGKSTILDALCLGLFDDTPRANHASENIQIADVKERTINQKDSRNILRRGTSDGYAEVDFISLGGEKFRSRWSVRRSRDRVDGSLQSSEFKLTNLTTNIEEQGTKTKMLAKVVELIGLTFDQFTRAVLLAQGDFATFLKATQKEKAELLEKLTGTDIYSRISMAIYDKSKEAEQELNLLKDRMKGIELLSEEEQDILTQEKQSVVLEIETTKKTVALLTAKVKWITDERDFNTKLRQSEQTLSDAKKAIEEAKPRYDFMIQVDTVQEIRDDFNELKNAQKQLITNKQTLAEQEKQRSANVLLLGQSLEKVSIAESSLQKCNEEFANIEPLIKQARELDVQITGAKTNELEAEKEHKQASETKTEIEKSIETTQNAIRLGTESILQIDEWFGKNGHYKNIIPRVDLILNLITDATTANKQSAVNSKTLSGSTTLLDNDMATLKQLNEEAERLNKLLPAEVIALRAKLTEGEPCPVCGSLHHPASGLSNETLEEAKLEKAKKEIADNITVLAAQIEQRKNENIRLDSLIGSYKTQYEEATDKLNNYLSMLPEWEAGFEQGVLADSLKTISETWREGEQNRTKTNERITNLQTTLELETKRLAGNATVLAEKELKHKNTAATLIQLQDKRKMLLDGQNADVIEKRYADRRKELTDTLAKLNEEKNTIIASNEKQEGVRVQLSQEIKTLSGRCDLLQKAVDSWLASKNSEITIAQLSELLSKTNQWLVAEREQLNRLHQNKTTAEATFAERKKNFENLQRAENKPSEDETEEMLKKNLSGKEELVQQKITRSVEIDILFENHSKGKERIKQFEKELSDKGLLSENWKKLNEMFGSADGAKFKVLAQGYTLDVLLSYANKHLQELSKRYEIQRIPDTLALQVIDLDMLGEVRTVHSLSGGESFLISLALALGLSSLSSNRMKIESLFIDEGFGSLDVDTLRVAMDALERLQTQGRKIGVISHVAEMTERINTQIHVEKMANGRSRIEIKGS
ncbi:MAG: AAA family ATPase [Holosporales bacterium]|jgi:exonuclease SbcC|nr:AAA family ATPase [Holosporales bacterium]